MGQPQIGPGKAERFESHQRDIGRQRVTGNAEDAFAFRTPSLRNVLRTGPWGHAGAFVDLREFLVFHSVREPDFAGYSRDVVLVEMPGSADDWAILDDPAESNAILAAAERRGLALSPEQLDDLVGFLGTLSDDVALNGRLGIPIKVPSGLAIDR